MSRRRLVLKRTHVHHAAYQEQARAHQPAQQHHHPAEVRVAHTRRRAASPSPALPPPLPALLPAVLPLEEPQVRVDGLQVQPAGLGALEQAEDRGDAGRVARGPQEGQGPAKQVHVEQPRGSVGRVVCKAWRSIVSRRWIYSSPL